MPSYISQMFISNYLYYTGKTASESFPISKVIPKSTASKVVKPTTTIALQTARATSRPKVIHPTPRPKQKLVLLEDSPFRELSSEEEEDNPIASLISRKKGKEICRHDWTSISNPSDSRF